MVNDIKTVVVTGGAGFIGSNLVELLLEKGYVVKVVDNFSVGKRENLPTKHKNLLVFNDDVRDRKRMQVLFKDCDLVFHLATQCVRKSIRDPWLVHDVNTSGVLSVLDAALDNKVKRFVYVSSSEAYGSAEIVPMPESHPLNPTTIYGASKLTGELYSLAYMRTYGLPVVVIRPFNTYGYNEHFEGPYGEVIPRFVVRALNNLPLQVFGDGMQTRDFTFVTDTADGIFKAATKGILGETYNIARGQEVNIVNLAKIVKKITNTNVSIQHLPDRPGDVRRHSANVLKAAIEFNFEAKIGILEGVKKYLDWFKETMPNPKEALKFYQQENW